MTHLSRVLVAIDFSRPARRAFDYALELSRHRGAELIAVQAVPTNETFARHAGARVTLAEKLRARADKAGVEFSLRVQTGDPAEIVLLHARSLRPDVIVLGTHQRRGLDRLRAGSVAERIGARAMVPVLLVPGSRSTGAVGSFRHVAVAVDFSAGSRRAIEHALTLARHPDDRITLIHVLPDSLSHVPPHLYGYGLAQYQDPSVEDVQRHLRTLIPAETKPRAALEVLVVRGDTATTIAEVVNSIGADLLVVGVTKRGVVSRALFGSTAVRLLRVTPVPMLAVPDLGARAEEESTAPQLAA